MSSKTPARKRKGSDVAPGAPKKAKQKTEEKESKKTPKAKKSLKTELYTESGKPIRSEKQYMAICNMTMTQEVCVLGVPLSTTEKTMCSVSDVQTYYHRACTQARDRMAEKVKDLFLPADSWKPNLPTSEKIGMVVLAMQMGVIPGVKTFKMNVWIQDFHKGLTVGSPKTAMDNTYEDSDPKSKINPVFDAQGRLVSTDEAKASSSSSS